MKDGIKALPEGAKVDMLVHPNSNTIWELKHDGKTILSFEESQKDIKNENVGFIVLGIFMYFCAAIGFGSLLIKGVRARKNNKRSKKEMSFSSDVLFRIDMRSGIYQVLAECNANGAENKYYCRKDVGI